MQWSLFLPILMGQCFLFTCNLYEYHFIGENKTWHEALRYCREKYTDLAKVFDMADMRKLLNATQNHGEAWIGLNNTDVNRTWHWSLPGVEYIENESSWDQQQERINEAPGDCGRLRDKWADVFCTRTMWFICYEETKKDNKTLHLIKEPMNWMQAQSYCRHHHTDLASGPDQLNSEEMKELKMKNSPMSVWTGLFRDTWRWSDGSDFSFRVWDMDLFNDEQSNKKCAMTLLNRSGKLSSDDCNKKKTFFCYDDKVVLIKENKTWEQALDYCRKNYSDLVSITTPYQQKWVEERAKKASTGFVWLGLCYSCTLDLWFWVSDKLVCYEKWATEEKIENCSMSVGMETGGKHEWFSKSDNETYNFICSKQ